MIRVNLLRSTGLASASPSSFGASIGFESGGENTQKLAIGKLVVILVFPLLLYAYEYSNLSSLQEQFATVDAEAKQLEAKKQTFGDAAPKVEKYTKLKRKIDYQMEEIRKLTKNRLREVKALDAIQEITPPQVWYDSLSFKDENVIVKGYALTDADLGTLYQRLSTSPLFSNFTPGTQGQSQDASGKTVTKFDCRFSLGKQGSP